MLEHKDAAPPPSSRQPAAIIKERLLKGDVLRILFADGVGFDVWAEKYANPPQVFFEGKPRPFDQLDAVVASCEAYLDAGGVKSLWNGAIP